MITKEWLFGCIVTAMEQNMDMKSLSRWAIYEADDDVFMSWYINCRHNPTVDLEDRINAEERYEKREQQLPPELRRTAMGF